MSDMKLISTKTKAKVLEVIKFLFLLAKNCVTRKINKYIIYSTLVRINRKGCHLYNKDMYYHTLI